MIPFKIKSVAVAILLLLSCHLTTVFAEGGHGEGSDIEIGGIGSKPGQFDTFRDLAIDTAGQHLYTLEGHAWDDKSKQEVGNRRIQEFSLDGKFIRSFSITRDTPIPRPDPHDHQPADDPSRMAIDSAGNVYIAFPRLSLVEQFSPDGVLLRSYTIPSARCLTRCLIEGKERIAVAGDRFFLKAWRGTSEIQLLDPAGAPVPSIKLEHPLPNATAATTDAAGNLCLLAGSNQIYRIAQTGKIVDILGSGTTDRPADNDDISQFDHLLTHDSTGHLYTWSHDKLLRFDTTFSTISAKDGKFYWYENWTSPAMNAVVDATGHLWLATDGSNDGTQRYHFRPALIRLKSDWWNNAATSTVLTLGLRAAVKPQLTNNITEDLAPITIDLSIPPARRRIDTVRGEWIVYDIFKNRLASQKLNIPLPQDTDWHQSISFTPPRFGWYEVEFHLYDSNSTHLLGVGAHIGVTPHYASLPDAPANAITPLKSKSASANWPDIDRSRFCGLPLLRIGADTTLPEILSDQAYADAHGMTLLVQLTSKQDCEPNHLRTLLDGLQGKVRYWEVINEPNFTMSPGDYAQLLARVAEQIRAADPAAKILGPAVCGINLDWYESFFRAGGGQSVDILTFHDYEGNEAIDPSHWRYKIAALRSLMTKYAVPTHELWQTERALVGTRTAYIGGVQAVRSMLHRDLLESLGIPSEHNSFYYLLEHGYSQCLSYLWSRSGPHPAALTLRTRAAMLLNRSYQNTLDFGPVGNRLFFALRYTGHDGTTIILHQLGSPVDLPLDIAVKGNATTIDAIDAFGNLSKFPVMSGQIHCLLGTLPLYLRLPPDQDISPIPIQFGPDLAKDATFSFSGTSKSDPSILNDGLFGVTHFGNPLQGKFWTGDWPADHSSPSLDITLSHPQKIDRLLLTSMRADNPYSFLLDFDIQAMVNGSWTTIQQIRTPLPPSDPVRTTDSKSNTWYMDQNFHLVSFPPTTTDKLHLIFHRATQGFMPDAECAKDVGWNAGGSIHINEIELFGPQTH